ncbi:YegP family protein [Arthrobacter sp.]|uniref:YegP family protein n=1 Tax=Arthrobacter sp. TaxID=1667 RepID=UPI002811BBDF|nr:YegP family protein [Arthrobacter sp.]
MTGSFEVFVDSESYFRFRLKAPDGTIMAVSTPFEDKPAAVAGITAVREYAGMGLITDLCPAGLSTRPPEPALAVDTRRPNGDRQRDDHQRVDLRPGDHRTAADHFRTRARTLRQAATAPRWTHLV